MSETKTTKKELKQVSPKKNKNLGKNADLLVSKAVRTVQANERQAPAKTLKRGEVRGGGRKPWKQKGTGRARAGSSRSPIWRGGGITFGPTGNENYSLSMNKKEMRVAKEAVLDSKKKNIQNLTIGLITKTKEAADFLNKNNLSGRVLILINAPRAEYKTLKKAFSNIKDVSIKFYGNENILDLMKAQSVVILKPEMAKSAMTKKNEVKKK